MAAALALPSPPPQPASSTVAAAEAPFASQPTAPSFLVQLNRWVSVAVERRGGESLRDVDKADMPRLPLFNLEETGLTATIVAAGDNAHAAAAVSELRALLASGACDVRGATNARAPEQPVRALGFDTETRPVFKAGQPPNAVSLVQLYAPGGGRVFLFRLQRGVPAPLCALLADAAVLKVRAISSVAAAT